MFKDMFIESLYKDLQIESTHFYLSVEDSRGVYHVFETPPTKSHLPIIQSLLKTGLVRKYSKFPTEYGFGSPLPEGLEEAFRIGYTKDNEGNLTYQLIAEDGYVIQEYTNEEAYDFCKDYNLPIKQILPM